MGFLHVRRRILLRRGAYAHRAPVLVAGPPAHKIAGSEVTMSHRCVLALSLLSTPLVAQADVLFGITNGNTLVRIDTASLTVTTVARSGSPTLAGSRSTSTERCTASRPATTR